MLGKMNSCQSREEEDAQKILSLLEIDGIVHIPQFAPSDICIDLKNVIANERKRNTHKKIGGSIARHLNFSFGSRNAKRLYDASIHRVISVAKSYLKSDHLIILIGGNVSLPGSVNQHWHADSDYRDNWLILNILIDDFTPKNGATQFILGTHKNYMTFARFLLNSVIKRFDVCSLKGCVSGDAILRDSNLWHRGTANKTRETRSMISISFIRSSGIEDEVVSARDEIKFYPNWFGGNRKIFEIIYVYFPFLFALKRLIQSIRNGSRQKST